MSLSSSAGAIARSHKHSQALRTDRHGITLYNGSFFEPVFGKYDGRAYTIPPDGETEEHCQQDPKLARTNLLSELDDEGQPVPPYKFDGTLEILDVYQAPAEKWYEFRKRKKAGANVQPPSPTVMVMQAADIVGYLAASFEDRGVVILTGDPKRDEDLKRLAKDRWMEYDIARCEFILAQYQKRCELFRSVAGNRGKPDPLMNKLERSAQERLDYYNVGLEDTGKMLCPVVIDNERRCGFYAEGKNAEKSMKVHLQAAHPLWKPEAATPPKGEETEEAQPRSRRKSA